MSERGLKRSFKFSSVSSKRLRVRLISLLMSLLERVSSAGRLVYKESCSEPIFCLLSVLRLDKSKPLLEEIKTSIQAARTGALPKSALAKACDYTLTLWSRLSRFLEYPELESSNNLAENAMRPVALGRTQLDTRRQ
jgi:hypothetical protein